MLARFVRQSLLVLAAVQCVSCFVPHIWMKSGKGSSTESGSRTIVQGRPRQVVIQKSNPTYLQNPPPLPALSARLMGLEKEELDNQKMAWQLDPDCPVRGKMRANRAKAVRSRKSQLRSKKAPKDISQNTDALSMGLLYVSWALRAGAAVSMMTVGLFALRAAGMMALRVFGIFSASLVFGVIGLIGLFNSLRKDSTVESKKGKDPNADVSNDHHPGSFCM
eukprot:757123-Hanusia_phi.AAC.4